MSTRSDPLVTRPVNSPDRLFYAQGVLLDAEDFGAEQAYHRGRQARALQYLFGTGTVAGLRVGYESATDEIVVQPGLAIDPLGRLVEVTRKRCLRLRAWFDAQRPEDKRAGWANVDGQTVLIADVFIRLAVCEHGKTPAFAAGPFDALDAVQPSRLRDGNEFGLVIREEAGIARDPEDIPVPTARTIALGLPPDPEQQLDAIEDRVLDAWRDGTSDWEHGKPPRLIEHLPDRVSVPGQVDLTEVGRDPTSILLARVAIRVDTTPETPTFVAIDAGPDNPNNRIRRFIYNSGYLTRAANRGAP